MGRMNLMVLTILAPALGCIGCADLEFLTDFLSHLTRSNALLVNYPRYANSLARKFVSIAHIGPDKFFDYLVLHLSSNSQKPVVVLRGNDFETYRALVRAVKNELVLAQLTWINIQSALNVSIDVDVPYDSEFFIAYPGGAETFEIVELYTLRNTAGARRVSYGKWSKRRGIESSSLGFYSRRMDMNGYEMNVLVSQDECQSGMHCSFREIWFSLAGYMNITSKISTIEEHENRTRTAGRMQPWDVVLEPVTFDLYSFSTKSISPIWKLTVFMHVKHESDQEISWSDGFSRFRIDFLAAFSLWIAVTSLWLTFVNFVRSRADARSRFRCDDGFFTILFSMCNQAGVEICPNLSALLVAVTIRMAVHALQILTMGRLVSILALRSPHYPFHDADGFMSCGNYRLGTVNGSLTQFYYRHTPLPAEIAFASAFVPSDEMPVTLRDGADRMCEDGDFVFLADNDDLLLLDNKKCHILRVPVPVAVIYCGIHLDDRSPFQFVFKTIFLKFLERGVAERMRMNFRGELRVERLDRLRPITYHQVEPFLSVILFGVAFAALLCFMEKLLWKMRDILKVKCRTSRRDGGPRPVGLGTRGVQGRFKRILSRRRT